jgi:CRP/FNR family transcriptional regulator, dissimilatory nitrate respiration regulator
MTGGWCDCQGRLVSLLRRRCSNLVPSLVGACFAAKLAIGIAREGEMLNQMSEAPNPRTGSASQAECMLRPDWLSESLATGAALRELAAGEELFRRGDRATAIFAVESGRLRLVRRTVDDHLVVLHTASAGEFFAEAALFAKTYHCDAVAAQPSRLRVYPKARLLAAMRAEPALLEAFTTALAHQLQALRARLELRNIRSARARLLQYFALAAGVDGCTVRLEGPLQDIAGDLGLSREALYRTLAKLESSGFIARTKTTIVLRKSTVA